MQQALHVKAEGAFHVHQTRVDQIARAHAYASAGGRAADTCTLNSCYSLRVDYRQRSGIDEGALGNVVSSAWISKHDA